MNEPVESNYYFTASASLLVPERRVLVTVTYSTKTDRKLLVKGKPIFTEQGKFSYIINTAWGLTDVQYSETIDANTKCNQRLIVEDLIRTSRHMTNIIDLALHVVKTDSTILLAGESGAGKGLLTKPIHRASKRKSQPWLQFNCIVIPEALLEA